MNKLTDIEKVALALLSKHGFRKLRVWANKITADQDFQETTGDYISAAELDADQVPQWLRTNYRVEEEIGRSLGNAICTYRRHNREAVWMYRSSGLLFETSLMAAIVEYHEAMINETIRSIEEQALAGQ